ncbi:unnamed protein product [Closterium sp. Yama58-4]|nr:unnamed protein product [Closterium sp. Yama58-4]
MGYRVRGTATGEVWVDGSQRGRASTAGRTAAGSAEGNAGGSAGGNAASSDAFVNEGLLVWTERRQQWLDGNRLRGTGGRAERAAAGGAAATAAAAAAAGVGGAGGAVGAAGTAGAVGAAGYDVRGDGSDRPRAAGPVIRPGSTYEDLLSTSRPFPQPIPLPEMVRFLVNVWEQEGLYD